ncbi:hypothetical protein ACFLXU_07535 [Chloroflexota bacterium]
MNNHLSLDQSHELWILLNQVRDTLLKAHGKELRPHDITATKSIHPQRNARPVSRRATATEFALEEGVG